MSVSPPKIAHQLEKQDIELQKMDDEEKLEDEVAVDQVMEAVINTIPNLPAGTQKQVAPPSYRGPSDEFLVQI